MKAFHQSSDWAVIGGGVLGQALALRLRDAGHSVTIIEAAPDLGGLTSVWTVGGVTYDKFYHVILPFDHNTLSLLEEIGLSDAVEWKETRTGFFSKGHLAPLNGALDYLRLNAIGLISKFRLAFHLMTAARISDGAALEQVPVKDWLIRWSGRAAFEGVWRPLLRAKLGDNAEHASAAFIWASMRRLYLARKGSAKVEQLGFVRGGGYRRILDALRARLDECGVQILSGTPVKRVARTGDCMTVETDHGTMQFANVVSTVSARASLRMCEGLGFAEKDRLKSVLYQGIVCASVVLKRPLAGYYLTYLTDESLPFTGIVEMSALTGTEGFGGQTLVYLPRYVTQDDPFWSLDDDEVRSRFVDGLMKVHPDLSPSDIIDMRISRARDVMAVPVLGYRDKAPEVRTSVPGLFLVNSAQIIDGTLNVDATLGVIDAALPILLDEASAPEKRAVA